MCYPGFNFNFKFNLYRYNLRARTVAVHFVNTEDGSSAGVLHVDVRPRAMTVVRTFRFQASEHDFFKARLPPPPGGAVQSRIQYKLNSVYP
jgi:hypothetical protein